MDHTAQRRHGVAHVVEQGLQGREVADIAAHGLDLHTLRHKRSDRILCFGHGCRAAPDQYQVACPLGGEPLRGTQAKSAQTTGDEVGGVGRQGQRRRHHPGRSCASTRRGRGIETQHDLADMAGLLHEAERADHILRLERPIGQRMQGPEIEQLHQFLHQGAGQFRPVEHQLVNIDAEVGDVVAQRTQADRRVLVEVPLAKFKKAPQRLQDLQAAHHRLARQRVEHHIHATAAGQRQDLVAEGQAARIEHMVDIEQAQQVALGLGPGGGEDFRALHLRDLDRGQSDAACGAMDKHLFARREPGQVMQAVIRGEERRLDSRRSFEGPCCRLLQHRRGSRDRAGGKTGGGEGDDFVAYRDLLDAAAQPGDDTGNLHAQGVAGESSFQRFFGQLAHRAHHVAEIEASGAYLDDHLVFPRIPRGTVLPVQVPELPGSRTTKLQAGSLRVRRGHGAERPRIHPYHEATGRCQDDLILGIRLQQQIHQCHGGVRRLRHRKIHQPERKIRAFVDGAAHETPERGIVRILGDAQFGSHRLRQQRTGGARSNRPAVHPGLAFGAGGKQSHEGIATPGLAPEHFLDGLVGVSQTRQQDDRLDFGQPCRLR